MTFQVSVIIPVYNAEPYVEQAVESALMQPEVAEVILVEDNSPDGSLKVCERLAEENEKVKLFRHPNGENRGAGASRNLGIENCACEFVAFLDADDFYLPERFAETAIVLSQVRHADAVFEAVEPFFGRGNKTRLLTERLVSIPQAKHSDDVLQAYADGTGSGIHLNGLTIKKKALVPVGLFDTKLRLYQDLMLILRLAAEAQLIPGRVDDPVAKYRLHDRNRYLRRRPFVESYRHALTAFEEMDRWAASFADVQKQRLIMQFLLRFVMFVPHDAPLPLVKPLAARLRLLLLLFYKPALLTMPLYWANMLPGRLIGKSKA